MLIVYNFNFCFSAKVKHKKKGRKEKLEKRSFVLYQHSCMVYLSSKIERKLITFFANQNIILENLNKQSSVLIDQKKTPSSQYVTTKVSNY